MNNELMVLQDVEGSYLDRSNNAKDYLRDDFPISLIEGDDFLYIGLYKPFNSVYVEGVTFSDPLIEDLGLEFEINAALVDVEDDTKVFSRSGFMNWTKPEAWVAETIDGKEAFWIRIAVAAGKDPIALNLRGLNIVFSDDNSLRSEIRNIDLMLAKGDTSFIAYHQGARDEIIQTLSNGGHLKESKGLVANLTKWDILDRGEISNAAKYLCLAKIFFDVSKNNEDKYYLRFRDFQAMYGDAFDTYILKIDTKDDGIYGQNEDLEFTDSIEIVLG